MPWRTDGTKRADFVPCFYKCSRTCGDSGKSEQLLARFAGEQSAISRKKPSFSITNKEFGIGKRGKDLVNRSHVIEMSTGESDCADRASQFVCRPNNVFGAPGQAGIEKRQSV